jgi:hypothetical protein
LEEEVTKIELEVRQTLRDFNKLSKDISLEQEEDFADEFEIDDLYINNKITDETWKNYIEFLEIVNKALKKGMNDFAVPGFKSGLFLGLVYMSARRYIDDKTENKKDRLYDLWTRIGSNHPLPACTKFVRKMDILGRDVFYKYWEKTVINEDHERSIFANYDKLKIMDAAISKIFMIQEFRYYDYLKAYFPLHNEYELTGWERITHPKQDDIDEELDKAIGTEIYKTVRKEIRFVIPEWKIGC